MNTHGHEQREFHHLISNFSETDIEKLERYFDLALEIAGQDSVSAESAFDIVPAIFILKERSNSKLKDQS